MGYRAHGVRPDAERREVFRRGVRLRRGDGPRHRPRPGQHRRHPRRQDRQGGRLHGRQVHPAQDPGEDRRRHARGRRRQE